MCRTWINYNRLAWINWPYQMSWHIHSCSRQTRYKSRAPDGCNFCQKKYPKSRVRSHDISTHAADRPDIKVTLQMDVTSLSKEVSQEPSRRIRTPSRKKHVPYLCYSTWRDKRTMNQLDQQQTRCKGRTPDGCDFCQKKYPKSRVRSHDISTHAADRPDIKVTLQMDVTSVKRSIPRAVAQKSYHK